VSLLRAIITTTFLFETAHVTLLVLVMYFWSCATHILDETKRKENTKWRGSEVIPVLTFYNLN
jgi:heme/copper-type cytochrome/quinol oxidase subunit 2